MITCGGRRQSLIIFAVFTLLLVAIFYKHDDLPDVPKLYRSRPVPKPSDRLAIRPIPRDDMQKVHLLLPSSSGEVNMCKTLLSAAVLGYPIPTLLSYNQSFDDGNKLGGGRYISKIEKTLQWLDDQPEEHDDDLVLLVDAYGGFNYYSDANDVEAHLDGDVWFQLPMEVLMQRYHAVTEKANKDLMTRMGKVYESEGIRQSILFGASKQCTPSDAESSACYPIPDSPLPNIYGRYTDDMSYNHTTHLPRYLSSAYTIGPVKSMRSLFTRAVARAHADDAPSSDQVIFQRIFGEQEYQREVMRRRYGEAKSGATVVEGMRVEDVLDPIFPHEVLPEKPRNEKEDEFGIGVDYWGDVGAGTHLGANDGRWLTYNQHVAEQLMARGPRQSWSCAPQVSGRLPLEIHNSTSLPRAAVSDASQFSPHHGWDEIPLYTNICLDTIPAIVNHNGDRRSRDRDWPEMWMQPHGRRLIDEILDRGEGTFEIEGGAYGGINGDYKTWDDLCPAAFEEELFNDYYDEV